MSGYGSGPYGSGPYGGGTASGRTEKRYSPATEAAWARLPDFYREADVDGVLKAWLSALFDQVGEMRELRERFDITATPPGLRNQPTGERLSTGAGALPVRGSWTAVRTPSGAVALQTDGPAGAVVEWQVRVGGGVYQLESSYLAGPTRGVARIEVDGAALLSLDHYSPTVTEVLDTALVAEVPLTRGLHSVRLVWTGSKRAASTGTSLAVTSLSLRNVRAAPRDGSDLTDPATADDRWLEWLGQFVGARLAGGLTAAQRRDSVQVAAKLRTGSRAHMLEVVQSVLTGNREVRLYPHERRNTSTGLREPGGPWDLLIMTNAVESPSSAEVIAAVTRQQAKPAGVRLHHLVYAGTWADFHARYPTWAAVHAKRTWTELSEASL